MLKKCLLLFLLGAALPVMAAAPCEPSRWGADDEIGNANLVTPETVLAATRLVKTGKTYPLGIVIDSSTPAFAPRTMSLHIVQPGQQQGRSSLPGSTYNDDVFTGWFGIGSQLDGLGHIGDAEGIHYNCFDTKEFAQYTGLTRLGIHNIPPLVTRGIVLDMAGHYGKDYLQAGESFSAADVQAVEKAQGTPVREGDVVLFHTGWTDAKLAAAPDEWVAGEPGIDEGVARYLAQKNVVAVGADTWGVDVVPTPEGQTPFAGHLVLLKDNGIYLLETMNTGPLVRDSVHEFLFVLGQARVRGAVQMMVNPVAIQ